MIETETFESTLKKNKIAILAGPLGHGGIGTIVLDHCTRFPEYGVEVDLLTDTGVSPFEQRVPSSAHRITLASLHPIWGVPGLARYLYRARPQALLNHRPRLLRPLRLAMRLSGVHPRLVSVIHTLRQPFDRAAGQGKPSISSHLSRCDALVATSHAIADDSETLLGLRPGSIRVAYPSIDAKTLLKRSLASPTAPDLSGPPSQYLISIARLEVEKDLPTLLEAFARLAAEWPDLELVVLGSGSQHAALLHRASQLGIGERTHFAGFARDPYPWIARARALILPSRREPFGIVLAEALALGVPVVATNAGGPPEILDHGRYGRLVPPCDPEAMATAIRETLKNPPSTADLVQGVERFSPGHNLPVYLEALGIEH
jgi:glycosyltransferase involved in cell wall biosynthesis